MEDGYRVNGNTLPKLFTQLVREGLWQHPGDDVLKAIIPFAIDPLVFLNDISDIERETSGLLRHSDDPRISRGFYLSRGSRESSSIELPWLDVEKAVLIAVNRHLGDDVAIALDYRESTDDPRVVASHWETQVTPWQAPWGEISRSFSSFVEKLQLLERQAVRSP